MNNLNDPQMFSFGEPESVLDSGGYAWLYEHLMCSHNGRWFEPPVSFRELSKTFRAAVHHSSPIYFKRNLLASLFVSNSLFSLAEFKAFALDYLVFGNAFLQVISNRIGKPLSLRNMPTLHTRRGIKLDSFCFITQKNGVEVEQSFQKNEVFFLKNDDVEQEIYGLPEYLSALNSALLNEAATIFRRRYYKNGSHAGFILYISDPHMSDSSKEEIKTKLASAKGLGNFKNLFLHSSGGGKDGVQVIPLSEVAAKDEFMHIKNTTRDDALAAHRVPPQLLGILPGNVGGFGDIEKAGRSFFIHEIQPLQRQFEEINDWLGQKVITWREYDLIKQAQ